MEVPDNKTDGDSLALSVVVTTAGVVELNIKEDQGSMDESVKWKGRRWHGNTAEVVWKNSSMHFVKISVK